jgi:peptidoglycan-associated lipoprotein
MQLNKVLKGLLIAIPVITLTACSSTSTDNTSGGSGANDSQSGANTTMQSGNDNNNNVDVSVIEKVKTPEEIQSEQDGMLRQNQTIYFAFDKNNVESEFNDMLSAHARYLVKHPSVKITVEGHCDEHGTPEYNIALGERRAQSVQQFLTTLGVSPSQITTVSYGEEKPVDKSRTDAGFAKNRRAILVY